jgi:SAM-dependent methyltransferase
VRLGTYYRAALLASLGLDRVAGPVLDVGGHDGYWTARLSDARCASIDIAPEPRYAGVSYLRGDGMQLPFREDSFQVVFALDVIEHVADDQRLGEELLRVVRPGGRLVLTTPHRDIRIFPPQLQPWANRRWQHYRTPGYTPSALQEILAPYAPERLQVKLLKTWTFRHFYLPLSALWRLWRAPGERLARLAARLDSAQSEGPGGYVLAEVTK